MSAQHWQNRTIQPFAEHGPRAATPYDDEALDDWLASLSVGQFDRIMNFLIDQAHDAPSALDRPVA